MKKANAITQGDLFTFKATDERYKVLLCTSTYKERSPHNFTFAALTYDQAEKPSVEELIEGEFYGKGIYKAEYSKLTDKELKNVWTFHPEIEPYVLGSYGFIIWRKDFVKFQQHFDFIGTLKIVDSLDKNGNGGMNASDWNVLRTFFDGQFKTILPDRGQKTFKVKAIVRE